MAAPGRRGGGPCRGATRAPAQRPQGERREDALKHILTRRIEGGESSPESVGGQLGLSPKKAFRLLTGMETEGLVRSEGSRLYLTGKGEQAALQVLRAHRLWETWLAREAKMPAPAIHRRAEQAEHRLSPSQVDELDAQLGHPRLDPHGDPIPSAAGAIRELGAQPLSGFAAGERVRIVHVEDEPQPVFARISAMGLRPGAQVEITRRTPDQVTVREKGREHTLARLEAGNIHGVAASSEPERIAGLTPLAALRAGEEAEVVELGEELQGLTRRRLLDLGLTPGSRVTALLDNAFGDPRAYRVRGTTIALRKEQASGIMVRPEAAPQ